MPKKRKGAYRKSVFGKPLSPGAIDAIVAKDEVLKGVSYETKQRLDLSDKKLSSDFRRLPNQVAGMKSSVTGELSEIRILNMLRQLSDENRFMFSAVEIERTSPSYPVIDIWVHTLSGISLPIQVKTKLAAARAAQGQDLSIICVSSEPWTDEELAEMLVVRLEGKYKELHKLLQERQK